MTVAGDTYLGDVLALAVDPAQHLVEETLRRGGIVTKAEPTPFWEREDRGPVTVVRFTTRLILGLEMVQTLREELTSIVEREGRHRLVLNFEAVELCDSLFISTIFQLVKRLHSQHGRLVILSLGPGTGEIFAALPNFYPDSLCFSFNADDALSWCAGELPNDCGSSPGND